MDFIEQVVKYNWQALATLGWHKYLKEGKGLILLTEQTFGETEAALALDPWKCPSENLVEAVYVSFQQLAKIDKEIHISINPNITDYDPEISFVVCYKSVTGEFTWRIIHSPELKNAEVARLQDEGIIVEYKTIVRSKRS